MEHSPTRKHVQPLCSPALFSLALKISYVFVPQVWSITLLLPERILSTLGAKIGNISETSKKKAQKNSEAGEGASEIITVATVSSDQASTNFATSKLLLCYKQTHTLLGANFT